MAAQNGYKVSQHSEVSLDGLNAKELALVLSLVCSAYSAGHDESRQHWAPKYHAMREAAERATKDKDIRFNVGPRLVVSQ